MILFLFELPSVVSVVFVCPSRPEVGWGSHPRHAARCRKVACMQHGPVAPDTKAADLCHMFVSDLCLLCSFESVPAIEERGCFSQYRNLLFAKQERSGLQSTGPLNKVHH